MFSDNITDIETHYRHWLNNILTTNQDIPRYILVRDKDGVIYHMLKMEHSITFTNLHIYTTIHNVYHNNSVIHIFDNDLRFVYCCSLLIKYKAHCLKKKKKKKIVRLIKYNKLLIMIYEILKMSKNFQNIAVLIIIVKSRA